MDLAQLFKPVEKIVGLEITQGYLLAVLCEEHKKRGFRVTKKMTALPAGAIADGMPKDKAVLTAALLHFVQTNRDIFKSKYVILSLPSARVFTDVMKFPPLAKEQINESIALSLRSRALFPISPEELYYDWQPLAHHHDMLSEEVLVSFALRHTIDEYMDVCEQAGLAPLAFETPQMSLTRAIANFKEKPGLILRLLDEGVELSIVVSGDLHFSRFIAMPHDLKSLDEFKRFVKDEVFRTLSFFEVERPEATVSQCVLLSYFSQKGDIAEYLAKELSLTVEQTKLNRPTELSDSWVAAYGAALRGLVPRDQDTIVSLMAVGTEEAYRVRRLRAYVSLWADIVNATAVLFVALFAGALFFFGYLERSTGTQLAPRGQAAGVHAEVDALTSNVSRFNSAVSQLAAVDARITHLSSRLARMQPTLEHDGITITNLSAQPPGNIITISILAKTRDGALSFRRSLETSGIYERVDMPFLSVIQLADIQTNITLTLASQTL